MESETNGTGNDITTMNQRISINNLNGVQGALVVVLSL